MIREEPVDSKTMIMTGDKGKKIKAKTAVLVDRVMMFSLCAVLFTLPFSKSMVEGFFIIALGAWLVKRTLKYARGISLFKVLSPVKTKLNMPIAGLLLIGFLSTLTSVSFRLSIAGLMFKLFEWIMIYFMVVESISSRKRLNSVVIVLLSSMALITADGIFQFITGVDFLRKYPGGEHMILGSFDNRNDFAGWLVVMIPLALSLAYFWKNDWLDLSGKLRWARKVVRPFLWFLTSLLVICMSLTYSRGAWIAVVLSILFIGITRSRKLLVIMLVILLLSPFVVPKFMKERVSSIMRPGNTTISTRGRLWTEALSIIRDYPVLGCGLNTYAIVGPRYKTNEAEPDFYPHNSYLHMAAETGLLGLGMFIWLIFMLFRVSFVSLRNIKVGIYGAFLTGLLAGLFGFLVHSFVDTNIYSLQLGVLMWFVIGLIIAVQRIAMRVR
jgi:putative inorganic carbon (HCO3(-)) transporter